LILPDITRKKTTMGFTRNGAKHSTFYKFKASTTLFIKPIALVNMVRCPFNTLTKTFKPPTIKIGNVS